MFITIQVASFRASPCSQVSLGDVVHQPLLHESDSTGVHWHSNSSSLGQEVCILFLVFFSVAIAARSTELRLFIGEVGHHLALQGIQLASIARSCCHGEYPVKQSLMFIIKLFVENSERLIPAVRLRNGCHD